MSTSTVMRESLGRRVREIWIEWAREQHNPKPSWLVPWDELDEPSREVDRRIGAAIYQDTVESLGWARKVAGVMETPREAKALAERDEAIQDKNVLRSDRNVARQELAQAIRERDAAIRERDAEVALGDIARQERDAVISELDDARRQAVALRRDLGRAVVELSKVRHERDAALGPATKVAE